MSDLIPEIDSIYGDTRSLIASARLQAYSAVNSAMIQAYWNIGKIIAKNEQQSDEQAEYGDQLIKELSERLTTDFGDGFKKQNLRRMNSFYAAFPKMNEVRSELSWEHYSRLLRVENPEIRNFYMLEAIENRWSTRELDRQINTLLFERFSLSQDKEKALSLAKYGLTITDIQDIIKDSHILEFLELQEKQANSEKNLKKTLRDKLRDFFLQLGKGFSFVSKEQKITVDGDHFYIDLVFYNFILKCFVLIDLKVGKLTHRDVEQMDFYVQYFEKEFKTDDENRTIGLTLCAKKTEAVAQYTLLELEQPLFASKYKHYLPTEEEIKKEIEREISSLAADFDLGDGEDDALTSSR
jgi:predicted nuclease of restriction endonuclease-like (RecB) superfamily